MTVENPSAETFLHLLLQFSVSQIMVSIATDVYYFGTVTMTVSFSIIRYCESSCLN